MWRRSMHNGPLVAATAVLLLTSCAGPEVCEEALSSCANALVSGFVIALLIVIALLAVPFATASTMVGKAILGTLIYLITYVAIVAVNVLDEHRANPANRALVRSVSTSVVLAFTIAVVQSASGRVDIRLLTYWALFAFLLALTLQFGSVVLADEQMHARRELTITLKKFVTGEPGKSVAASDLRRFRKYDQISYALPLLAPIAAIVLMSVGLISKNDLLQTMLAIGA